MPTYKNARNANLFIESRYNQRAGVGEARMISSGEVFVAHSADIPARWLEQGNSLEGKAPWVSLVSETPTDEDLSG
jgi:hypothetical protein